MNNLINNKLNQFEWKNKKMSNQMINNNNINNNPSYPPKLIKIKSMKNNHNRIPNNKINLTINLNSNS